MPETLEPLLPTWGRTNADVLPAVTWGQANAVVPDEVVDAPATLVVVIDSLGWMQLDERRDIAPTLAAMAGQAVTTVAPSTTAAALTSISTGVAPGEHGIVGYRFPAGGSVMNALRWTTVSGDHRDIVVPADAQPVAPMAGGSWSVVSNAQFADSGFTEAHLRGASYLGWFHPASIITEVRRLLAEGERLVYAYYDGLDHIAHIHGVGGSHFDDELRFCDWLVEQLIRVAPTGTSVVVTADHGQIDAAPMVPLAAAADAMVSGFSGESRFRWLHAKPGATNELAAAVREAHGAQAWVITQDEAVDGGWFGPVVTDAARSRLGDVALVAHADVGFVDPDERHADRLLGRHGSVTPPEMLVPVLHAVV